MTEITRILNAIDQGDTRAVDQLLPLVYEELRCLAAQKLAQERPGQTLQATALVHEAYLRLVGSQGQRWDSRSHFFSAAAEAMRRVLVDNARRKQSLRRGGQRRQYDLLDVDLVVDDSPDEQLLALDGALSRLADKEPALAELVKLRHFAGLTVDEAAKALGISPRTVKRNWAYARAWLLREIRRADESGVS
jgi:RNA polymerase sigma factor (TIGR02999 family)